MIIFFEWCSSDDDDKRKTIIWIWGYFEHLGWHLWHIIFGDIDNIRRFTFPTMLPSCASCKIFKNTSSPDYIIRNRLLVLFGKRIPDQMLCAFLCLSLMWRVYVDRYMNPTQAAMQLQCSYEQSTMTMTPPTPLKN